MNEHSKQRGKASKGQRVNQFRLNPKSKGKLFKDLCFQKSN